MGWRKLESAPTNRYVLGWDHLHGTYMMIRYAGDEEWFKDTGWFKDGAWNRKPECWREVPEPVQHYDVDGGPFLELEF